MSEQEGNSMSAAASSPGDQLPSEFVAAVDLEASPPGQPVTSPRPWGAWASLGWTLLCTIALFVTQTAVVLVIIMVRVARGVDPRFNEFASDGNVLWLGTLASTVVVVGLVALIIRLRRYPIDDYLALRWPAPRSALIAFAGMVILLVSSDLTSYRIGRPLVPEVMVELYRMTWLPGLLLALVVLAPIGEETLFRGFLYKGIADSRAGPIAAIITSAIAWAPLHIQYDWYGVVTIAVMGLFLGMVRQAAGSLYLTMLLHAVANAVATLEIVIQEHCLR